MFNTCGHEVDADAWLCLVCGARVDRYATTQPIPVPEATPGEAVGGDDSSDEPPIRCPQEWCAQPVPAGAAHCPYCNGPIAVKRASVILPGGVRVPVEDTLILGRESPDQRVSRALSALDTVSRRHALLAWVEGRLTVHDLGSANGTWLNGAALTEPQPIDLAADVALGLGKTVTVIITTGEGN